MKKFYQSRWFTGCNDDEQAPLIQTILSTKSALGARLLIKLKGKSVISQKQIDNAKWWVNVNFPDFVWVANRRLPLLQNTQVKSGSPVTFNSNFIQTSYTKHHHWQSKVLVNVAQFPPFGLSTCYIRSHIYEITRAKSSHRKQDGEKLLKIGRMGTYVTVQEKEHFRQLSSTRNEKRKRCNCQWSYATTAEQSEEKWSLDPWAREALANFGPDCFQIQ